MEFTHITAFENIVVQTRIAAGAKKRAGDNTETGDSLILVDKLIRNTIGSVPQAYLYTLRMTIDALSPFDGLDPQAWNNFKEKHQLYPRNDSDPTFSDPATTLTEIIRKISKPSGELSAFIEKTDDYIASTMPDTSFQDKGFIVISEFLNFVSHMRASYLVSYSHSLGMEDQRILKWFINGPFSIQFTLYRLNHNADSWHISDAYAWQALSMADLKGHTLSPYAAEPYEDSNSPMDIAIQDIKRSGHDSLALQLLLDKPEKIYQTLPWNHAHPLTLYITDPFSTASGYLDHCILRRTRISRNYFNNLDLPPSCGSATDGATIPGTRDLCRGTENANTIYQRIQYGALHLGAKSLLQLLESQGVNLCQPSDDFLSYTTWASDIKSQSAMVNYLYPLSLTQNYSYIRL